MCRASAFGCSDIEFLYLNFLLFSFTHSFTFSLARFSLTFSQIQNSLTAIFDSCHSGTAMDLPYVYSTTGELKTNTGLKSAGKNLASAVPAYLKGNKMGALMSIGNSLMGAVKGQGAEEHARATRTSPADVIMLSGCKDSQTSADAQIAGNSTGAMSYAFRTALERNRQQSYQQLLISIRDILKQKYDQLPQLSSSHPMDMRLLFIM